MINLAGIRHSRFILPNFAGSGVLANLVHIPELEISATISEGRLHDMSKVTWLVAVTELHLQETSFLAEMHMQKKELATTHRS